MSRPTDAKDEKTLMTEIWDAAIAQDLEKFVMFMFPWGKANTPLERKTGPKTWQRDELQAITDHIRQNKIRIINGQDPVMYKSATASGRGIGKSTLVSWLILWQMSCNLGSSTIVSANTEDQLKTKTWAELGIWYTLSINSHWFDKQALSLKPQEWFKEALSRQLKLDSTYYYALAQLWSEENPDAFAGAHNQNGMLVIFDESSGIPKPIHTVTQGFFTDPTLHRYWLQFSNPRRNTGPFYECFHGQRDYWRNRNLDSRKVEGTDKAELEQIIKIHGEDSDEARIEVKGEFPRQGDNQFISREIINQARERELVPDEFAALYMGVDVARYGDDSTVIRFRQGRNGRIIAPIVLKHKDNMEVANLCAHLITTYNPDAVCIDSGNGTGVIDRLKEMGYKVHEIMFGSSPNNEQWANKRTELWADMRDWLPGAAIDNSLELATDLAGPQYKFMSGSDRLRLETKEEMKARGEHSPDHGDALACTFGVKVARRDNRLHKGAKTGRVAKDVDYKIFG